MLQDQFFRVHNYLRVSLTSNCNLRCFYCMPDEEHELMPARQLMQAHEIGELAACFVQLGVTKIRLTGGEPLVRKDAADIIKALSRLPVALTLTTNAVRVHQFINQLKAAGVRSINVSLDTLDSNRFLLMTRRNYFEQVRQNIQLLLKQGFHVKVNVVVVKGLNDGEIKDFIEWTRQVPVHVRFIEFMPFQGNRWTDNRVTTWQEIIAEAERHFTFIPLAGAPNDTARKYAVPGFRGTFAVISTMSAPFCSTCNRLRLTADGKLKNCLFSQEETDLLTPLRQGAGVAPLIRAALARKQWERGGQLAADMARVQPDAIINRSMIAIGG